MALLYVLVIILKSPLILLTWIWKHRAVALIAVVIVGFVIFSKISYGGGEEEARTAVQVYQKIAPETKWITPTRTRLYYTNRYTEDEEYYYLEDFFEYNREWQHRTKTLPLLKTRALMIPNEEGVR